MGMLRDRDGQQKSCFLLSLPVLPNLVLHQLDYDGNCVSSQKVMTAALEHYLGKALLNGASVKHFATGKWENCCMLIRKFCFSIY